MGKYRGRGGHQTAWWGQYVKVSGWGERHPPAADEEIGRWTISLPSQLLDLRVTLRDVVTASVLPVGADPADLTDRLTIVTTELAGNALRHGRPPAVVALSRCDDRLIVDVADADEQTAPQVSADRKPGAGGLGLQLTERLSDEVGWYPDTAGKHVWSALAVASLTN
jgi:anti-sigma regulatory factor (Ser/Thr protein kinase)